jgi:hypothetical protein
MPTSERFTEQWVVRASIAGLFLLLSFLAALSLVMQRETTAGARRAETATTLSATYQDARHWVEEVKSVERAYRLAGSGVVALTHRNAERRLVASLRRVGRIDRDPASRRTVARLLALQREYHAASGACSPPSTAATPPRCSTTTTR